jgi:hypothetical protein
LALPITTTKLGTLHTIFTNPIMIIRVNRTTNRPPMSSMAVKGYKRADVVNIKGGYREPFVVIA